MLYSESHSRIKLNTPQESDNDFVATFKKQYKNSNSVLLAVSFVELAVARTDGSRSSKIPEIAMDFLTATQCKSPSVFRMLSDNICGATERHVLR